MESLLANQGDQNHAPRNEIVTSALEEMAKVEADGTEISLIQLEKELLEAHEVIPYEAIPSHYSLEVCYEH